MLEKVPIPGRSIPSRAERRLSFALLGVLAGIAAAVLAAQFRYDPARWQGQAAPSASSAEPAAAAAGADEIGAPRLQAMSAWESYDAQSLSDKIDGKAELYLPAGFRRLQTRRYTMVDDRNRWLELFIFDMGLPSGAFAVYSQQRREQAQPLELSRESYRSSNGIFLVQDHFYLEIVGSDSSAGLGEQMIELAKSFIALHPASAARADERAFFPQEGRVPDSIALTAEKAFGFDPFDNIYTAQYRRQNHTATAFLSRRSSEDEAARLAEAYLTYLREYGGERVVPPAGAARLAIIKIMDSYEIVFQGGAFLAGVHEADDLPFALELADQLQRGLQEGAP